MTDKERRKEFRLRERKIEYWGGIPVELPHGVTPSEEYYRERKEYLANLMPKPKGRPKPKTSHKLGNSGRTPEQCIRQNIGAAKQRAKKKGISFDTVLDDLLPLPTHCPILNIKLCYDNTSIQDNSPSLDRKNPNLGYVQGNVWIISNRANTIKSVGTPEEHLLIYEHIKDF